MIKRLACVLAVVCSGAFAQICTTPVCAVTGTYVTDSGGTVVPSGKIYFQPNTPFRIVTKGQAIPIQTSAVITNGAFTINLADTTQTVPQNISYHVYITDASGKVVSGSDVYAHGAPYADVQMNNTWCTSSGCNFDSYDPSVGTLAIVGTGVVSVNGRPGVVTLNSSDVPGAGGNSIPLASSADRVLGTTASATGSWLSVPLCLDSIGQHLNYNTSTHQFSCGTSSVTSASPGFDAITSGTNTSAAMLVGNGASLGTTGSGTITANAISGIASSALSDGSTLAKTGVDINTSNQVTATHLASALPFAQGGTGQATQQAAMNALAGAQSAGKYLRSDGTNTTLSNIQAADVPTLNQATTGNAATATKATNVAGGAFGSIPYQSALDTTIFLAGNTTTTTKFLTETGNGTIASDPAWNTIDFSNLTGNIVASQMNSGTGASATTCWHGDNSWGSCGSGASVTGYNSSGTSLGTITGIQPSSNLSASVTSSKLTLDLASTGVVLDTPSFKATAPTWDYTAGVGGCTAGTLVRFAGSGDPTSLVSGTHGVVIQMSTTDSGLPIGVCTTTVSAGAVAKIAKDGLVQVLADNTITPFHIIIAGSVHGGYGADGGSVAISAFTPSRGIAGIALTSATSGQLFWMDVERLYGTEDLTLTTTGSGAATYTPSTRTLNIPGTGGGSSARTWQYSAMATCQGPMGSAALWLPTSNAPNYTTCDSTHQQAEWQVASAATGTNWGLAFRVPASVSGSYTLTLTWRTTDTTTSDALVFTPSYSCVATGGSPDSPTYTNLSTLTLNPSGTTGNNDTTYTFSPTCATGSQMRVLLSATTNSLTAPANFSYEGISVAASSGGSGGTTRTWQYATMATCQGTVESAALWLPTSSAPSFTTCDSTHQQAEWQVASGTTATNWATAFRVPSGVTGSYTLTMTWRTADTNTGNALTLTPSYACVASGASPDNPSYTSLSTLILNPSGSVGNRDATYTFAPSCAAGSQLRFILTATGNTLASPAAFSYQDISVQASN